jgi:FKBP-type peptidyl-prolyl cis-trans isomerase
MRRAAALVTIPLLAAAAVAGCSSSSSPSSSSSAAAAGDTNKSVTATGTFGKAPTVKIPAEKGTGDLYTKTLIQGSGTTLTSSDGLIGNYVAYDWSGKTNKLLGSSFQTGKPQLFLGPFIPGLQTALIGQKLGSRVLAVIPPAEGFGTTGNSSAGIGAGDTLVFVVDLDSAFGTEVVPGTQTANGGGTLPTVTPPAANSKTGPTIKIPASGTPPKTLQVQNLITGTGAKVVKGQELVVQYTGVNWRTKSVFDSSYKDGQVATIQIGEGHVIPGWDTGLVGKTVGSRVLLVIPPADGYGKNGNSQAGIKGTDTLVFVVDILAAVTP